MSATRIATFWLVSKEPSAKIELQQELLLGRETGINAGGVSRRHCMIKFFNGSYYVADLKSTNGTFLNGRKLEVHQWNILNPGDSIRIGDMNFQLASSPQAASAKPPEVVRVATETKEEQNRDSEKSHAGYGIRLAAFLLDCLFILGWCYLMGKVLPLDGAASPIRDFIGFAAVIVFPTVFLGQTIGKKIVGLKVVTSANEKVHWKRMIVREIVVKCGFPLLFVGLLGILAAFHPAAPLAMLIVAPILFIIKTRKDGMFFWDALCGTKVIAE